MNLKTSNLTDISLKHYLFFKDNHKQYLLNKSITSKQIDDIKKLYCINSENNHLNKPHILLDFLKIKSFYCNHNLFKELIKSDNDKNVSYKDVDKIFHEKLYNQTYNELADIIDYQELHKNICFVDSKQVDYMILQKALIENNKELYDFIDYFLKWDKNKDEILQSMCYVIENYGKNIKNNPLSIKITKHIYSDNFYRYKFHLDTKKKIENVNSFFNIDIKKYVVEAKLPPLTLKNLNFGEKQLENILENIDKKKDNYYYIVYQYFKNTNSQKSIGEKFLFLEKENLLNENIWTILINPLTTDFIKTVFINHKVLKNILEPEKLEKALAIYKEYFFQKSRSFEDIKEYIEHHPGFIDRENLITIINNIQTYSDYMTPFNKQCSDYVNNYYKDRIKLPQHNISNLSNYETIEKEVIDFLDYLYDKFPQYLNNEETILNIAKISNNDIFVGLYLDKYFTNNNNIPLKEHISQNLKVMKSYEFSRTLQWLAENNLVVLAINDENPSNHIFIEEYYNYLMPYLIDKCELSHNVAINATLSQKKDNEELFSFILDNYKLKKSIEINICKHIYISNKTTLAQEIFKKDIMLDDSIVKLCTALPNEAGNILLKLNLKHKLENKSEHSRQKSQNKVKKI